MKHCILQRIGKGVIAGIVVGLVVFLLVLKTLDYYVLCSFGRVLVEMESDVDTHAALYYSAGIAREKYSEQLHTPLIPVAAGQRRVLSFHLDNKVIKRLRLDPGAAPGLYRIFRVELRSFFGKSITLIPYLQDVAVRCGPDTSCSKQETFLEVAATGSDPYVIFDRSLRVDNPVLRFLVPTLAGLIVFVLVSGREGHRNVLLQDLRDKRSSNGINYNALDGLRGMAALFVLADHTGLPGCDGFGMIGVVIFFCLSGFLLTQPFISDSGRILSWAYMRGYLVRRVKRIVPMYYTVIMIAYLFQGREGDFFRSALFLQGNSIFWAVLQEVHFYLLLPFILLAAHLVLRQKKLLIVFALLLLSLGFNHRLLPTHRIYALGNLIPLYAGVFTSGIMACYLQNMEVLRNSPLVKRLCRSWLFAALIFTVLVTSGHILNNLGLISSFSWVFKGDFVFLVVILLLLCVLDDRSPVARILGSTPLRLVGLISYSLYLLHPLCLKLIKEVMIEQLDYDLNGLTKFALTLLVAGGLSVFTYINIERSFIVSASRRLGGGYGHPS